MMKYIHKFILSTENLTLAAEAGNDQLVTG
jgi:hypothetical protein